MKETEITKLLQENNFRVTQGRTDVLSVLVKQKNPVGIDVLATECAHINQATIYRMMTAFVKAGIVDAHDLGHGHLDYELSNKPHHHHAVCKSCGHIEDIYNCKEVCEFQTSVLNASKDFSTIHPPNVTLFGVCKKCK